MSANEDFWFNTAKVIATTQKADLIATGVLPKNWKKFSAQRRSRTYPATPVANDDLAIFDATEAKAINGSRS